MHPHATLASAQLDAFTHFEHLHQAVLVTDAALSEAGPRILYANAAFERMTGWEREAVIGRTPRLLQGNDTDRNLMRELKVALQRGESWAGETVNYRRDGTPFLMKWSVAPVVDASGQTQRYIAIQEDVTTQRAREKRETHLTAMTQKVMAAASEGIIVTNADRRIVSMGAGAERIFGWLEPEAQGRALEILLPERHRPAHAHHMTNFTASGAGIRNMAERGEVVGLHRDGHEFPAMVTVASLGEQGDGGYIAVVRDLTIQKAQARQLADNERRYRAVFDLSYQFVGLLDAAGRVLEANAAALDFIDGSLEQLRGVYFPDTPWF